MLYALVLKAMDGGGMVKVWTAYGDWATGDQPDYVSITPQKEIDDYRVDFLLTEHDRNFGQPNYEPTYPVKIIVECDGHDFHERSKAQARHDRQRDRSLQQAGYLVFRYTGSEIWDSVCACAEEAINTLHRKNLEVMSARWKQEPK